MDEFYARTVRLLLRVAPDVFDHGIFAMKGGTAINLFVQDMPRLSVDIDIAYLDWKIPREAALKAIAEEIDRIATRLDRAGFDTRKIASKDLGETKLLVESDRVQVKIEVNAVFRGTVLPPARHPLNAKTAKMFSVKLALPILAVDELYGSKFVAALDRQHPRDLFDVRHVLSSGSLTEAMIECFVIYLAGHNRPTHEVLFSRDKEIGREFAESFAGMTREPVELSDLLEARMSLRRELLNKLKDRHKEFLIGLARAEPDWSLLKCTHAADLPALRWKLANLETFHKRRPAAFEEQASTLQAHFDGRVRTA